MSLCECPGCTITSNGNGYQPCHNLSSDLSLPSSAKKDPLEKDVEARFHRKIKAIGGMSWKFSSMNRKGVSDRIVLYHGRVIFVEMKRTKGKMSPMQKVFETQVMDNNGEFACVYGNVGTDAFIVELRRGDGFWRQYFNAVFIIIRKFSGAFK